MGTCGSQGETPAEVGGGVDALEQLLEEFGAAGPDALQAPRDLRFSRAVGAAARQRAAGALPRP